MPSSKLTRSGGDYVGHNDKGMGWPSILPSKRGKSSLLYVILEPSTELRQGFSCAVPVVEAKWAMCDRPGSREEALRIADLQHRSDLAEYEADVQRSLESFKAGNASGLEAIKASTLINGGAAVAILAFIGHLASIHTESGRIMEFEQPLCWFVQGALSSVVASGITYFMQRISAVSLRRELQSKDARRDGDETTATNKHNASRRWECFGEIVNLGAVLCVVYSLFCFGYGCYVGYHAFEALDATRHAEKTRSLLLNSGLR